MNIANDRFFGEEYRCNQVSFLSERDGIGRRIGLKIR